MKYQLTLDETVSFAPESVTAEILQNVRTIIQTRLGTVPLFRDFGLTWEHVDKPIHISRALLKAEIIEAVERWEPRAQIDEVEFEEDSTDAMEGLSKPRIVVTIGEENE